MSNDSPGEGSPLTRTAVTVGATLAAGYAALVVVGAVYVENYLDIQPPRGQYGIPMTCEPNGKVKKGIRLFIDKVDTPELTVRRRFQVVKNDGLDTNGDPDGSDPPEMDPGNGYHKTMADFDAKPYLKKEGDLMLVVVQLAGGKKFVSGPGAITTSSDEHGEMFCASASFNEKNTNHIRKFYVRANPTGTMDVIGTYWITTVDYNVLLPFIPAVVDHKIVDPNVKNNG